MQALTQRQNGFSQEKLFPPPFKTAFVRFKYNGNYMLSKLSKGPIERSCRIVSLLDIVRPWSIDDQLHAEGTGVLW